MARYPTYRRPRNNARRLVAAVVFIAVLAVGGWMIYGGDGADTANGGGDDGKGNTSAGNGNGGAATREANGGNTVLRPEEAKLRKAAMKDYNAGMKLKAAGVDPKKRDLIKLRAVLSRAVLSGYLPRDVEAKAVKELTTLASMTILSRDSYEGDSYTMPYTFQSGDFLSRVERRLKLHVSWPGLLRINGLTRPDRIRAGQVLKMIKGPFHGIVYKSRHIMDIYLHRNGMEKVFVRRVPVGLGKAGITPEGKWKVINRLDRGDYYPAANSPLKRRSIPYGDKDYAFGKKGLWIGLAGVGARTTHRTGYGLHSTVDQSSIGKSSSEGCIRLGDADSQLVYDLFYEQRSGDKNEAGVVRWSTVLIRP